MSSRKTLNLAEIQDLIANKPLRVVRLEHSSRNKKLIVRALREIRQKENGKITLQVLAEFLKNVAPKYELNRNQDGARCFLLRQIESLLEAPPEKKPAPGLLDGVFGMFGVSNKTA